MVVCANCGTENPEIARFCMTCASALEKAGAPQGEERKTVSVLFVDLVGFTARSHNIDPEDVRAALAPYHQRLKQEIERFGGTVEKFIGDAVMAVFGAPIAHEDDAERAVRTALKITDAIHELNEAGPNLDLSLRAAVNTGEALVTLGARPQSGEGIVTGDVVNTASRLQGVAPAGAVVVDATTYRSTRNLIEYQQLDDVTVKGKPQPIPVWRALSARSRFGIDIAPARSTSFIGRDFELDLLKQTFRRLLKDSSTQLVTIVGEPGVGKSRLVSELFSFIDEHTEVVFWRQGRCIPYGDGITFWALGEIIKAHAGILESDSVKQASEKLRVAVQAVIRDESERDWFVARLAALVGAEIASEAGAQIEESFTAWRRFLEAIADRSPLVIVVEDLHWADEAMLGFLEHLVEWSTGVPLLVISTARPELFEKHPAWGAGKHNSTMMSLEPLTDNETSELISELLSHGKLPAEVRSTLLERAGGNPLYAEQFVWMLNDRGILKQTGGVLAIDIDTNLPMPDTVQALIAARLDTLTPGRKELIHDAAVAGKVFWAGAVASVGEADEASVEQGLHELAKKELVRPARTSSIEGQQEYSFWHSLTREVSYSQIPRAARWRKHQLMAEWIEHVAGERVSDHAEVLAYHLQTACSLAKASGATQEAGALEIAARRFHVIAGDRAINLDPAKAEDFYGRALPLTPSQGPDRARVLEKIAEACFATQKLAASESHLEEAVHEYRKLGDARGQGRALTTLSGLARLQGDFGRSQKLLRESLGLLEEQSPSSDLSAAYNEMAFDRLALGFLTEGVEVAERAIATAQLVDDQGQLAEALQMRGIGRCEVGDMGGLADLQRALTMSQELNEPSRTAAAYNNLSNWIWLDQGPAKAMKFLRAGIELAEKRGLSLRAAWMKQTSADFMFDLGAWDEVLNEATEVIAWDRAHGPSQIQAFALTIKARTLFFRGDMEEAYVLEQQFLPLCRSMPDLQVLVPALATAAVILAALDRAADAADLIQELVAHTKDRSHWRAAMLPDVVRVLTSIGNVGLAEDSMVAERDAPTARNRNSILTARAALTEARGDLEVGAKLYAEAARCWEDYGHLLERGYGLLGAGRCLLNLKHEGEALTTLAKARNVFTDLRARPLLEETEALLARV